MKTKIFLLLLFTLFAVRGVASSVHIIEGNTTREIELSVKEEIEPRISVPNTAGSTISARAFLQDALVQIRFAETAKSVTVLIINESTNSIVFSQAYSSPGNVCIDLSGKDSGDYKLQMLADGVVVGGNFSL